MQGKKNKKLLPEKLEREIASEAYPLVEKFMEHAREICFVAVAVLLVGLGYSGYKIYTKKSIENAKKHIEEIMTISDIASRTHALERFLPNAPKAIKQSLRFDLVSLYLSQKQYKRAEEMWQRIRKAAGDDEGIKVVSILGEANTLCLENKYDQALMLFRNIKNNKDYEKIICMELAKIAEKGKKWKDALWAYEKLKAASSPLDPNTVYYEYQIKKLKEKIKG